MTKTNKYFHYKMSTCRIFIVFKNGWIIERNLLTRKRFSIIMYMKGDSGLMLNF